MVDPGSLPDGDGAEALIEPLAGLCGIRLEPAQIEQLDRHCRLVLEANRRFNLTAAPDRETLMLRHMLDSLAGCVALPRPVLQGRLSVVDVGAGAGFPAIPLAIARPRWRLTAVESTGKKCRFLEFAARELELTNLSVACDRAENLGQSDLRQSFDLGVARAVAATAVLLEYCVPLVSVGGHILLYKKGDLRQELRQASRAMTSMGVVLRAEIPIPKEFPVGDDHRMLLFEKVANTPAGFPRRPGVPRSRPL